MIHIFQKFENPVGGTEHHAISLYKVLSVSNKVKLWCEFEPHPELRKQADISVIDSKKFKYPKFGVFIFVGACWYVGRFIEFAFPRRIIVIHNYDHPSYLDWEKRAKRFWHPNIEWAFMSKELQQRSGKQGQIVVSPIPVEKHQEYTAKPVARRFTVGRLSRDVPEKHHSEDPKLYLKLASSGISVLLMGATVLKDRIGSHENIEVLPEQAMEQGEFFNSIDLFFYRTDESLYETFGRVIFEAMSFGVPVVCGNRGGFTEHIENSVNGFVIESTDEAFQRINQLMKDEALRLRVAEEAFNYVSGVYCSGLPEDIIDFYTR